MNFFLVVGALIYFPQHFVILLSHLFRVDGLRLILIQLRWTNQLMDLLRWLNCLLTFSFNHFFVFWALLWNSSFYLTYSLIVLNFRLFDKVLLFHVCVNIFLASWLIVFYCLFSTQISVDPCTWSFICIHCIIRGYFYWFRFL